MKKALCLLMALVTLMGATGVFAEDTQELPEIDFRGIELGATLADVQAVVHLNLGSAGKSSGTSLSEIMFYESGLVNPEFISHPENPSLFLLASISVSDVGGHEPDWTEVYFVRPVIDGAADADDANALFYAGSYEFYGRKRSPEVKDDLAEKLTELYGEPVKQESEYHPGTDSLIWYGTNDTAISLAHYVVSGTTRLTYVWLGAEALIEEAKNTYEAPVPVDNTDRYNGL